jgi:hypothetical protein
MFARHELPMYWGPSGREHQPWMATAWVGHTFALAQADAAAIFAILAYSPSEAL